MAKRPSDIWRSNLADEAAEVADGRREPEKAFYATLFPESLITATDRTLATFEQQVRTLDPAVNQIPLIASARARTSRTLDQRQKRMPSPDEVRALLRAVPSLGNGR